MTKREARYLLRLLSTIEINVENVMKYFAMNNYSSARNALENLNFTGDFNDPITARKPNKSFTCVTSLIIFGGG